MKVRDTEGKIPRGISLGVGRMGWGGIVCRLTNDRARLREPDKERTSDNGCVCGRKGM